MPIGCHWICKPRIFSHKYIPCFSDIIIIGLKDVSCVAMAQFSFHLFRPKVAASLLGTGYFREEFRHTPYSTNAYLVACPWYSWCSVELKVWFPEHGSLVNS